MAIKTVEELEGIVETQKNTLKAQETSIKELTNANETLTKANNGYKKDADKHTEIVSDLQKKVQELTESNDLKAKEVEVASEVVADLKKRLEEQAAEAVESGAKTIHKLGKRKFKLLFEINHNGESITDEALAGNEQLLKELVEGGSGAISEIL